MTRLKAPVVSWAEPQIRKALTLRYPSPKYALLSNVSCGAGRLQRYADALVMSLFPSRGLELIGFEIKSTRSDWLRELKKPEKADPIFQYCNRWYLAVANGEIVKDGELPEPWGLLVMTAEGALRQTVAAPKLEPKPIDIPFMAAIFRRAGEQAVDAKVIAAAKAEGFASGQESALKHSSTKHWQDTASDLQRRINDFEYGSGLKITGWTQPREIGEAVAAVLNANSSAKQTADKLNNMRRVALNIAREVDSVLSKTGEGQV